MHPVDRFIVEFHTTDYSAKNWFRDIPPIAFHQIRPVLYFVLQPIRRELLIDTLRDLYLREELSTSILRRLKTCRSEVCKALTVPGRGYDFAFLLKRARRRTDDIISRYCRSSPQRHARSGEYHACLSNVRVLERTQLTGPNVVSTLPMQKSARRGAAR